MTTLQKLEELRFQAVQEHEDFHTGDVIQEAIIEIKSLSRDKVRLDWILGLIEGGNDPARCIIAPNGESISRWGGVRVAFDLRPCVDLSMLRWNKIYDPRTKDHPLAELPPRCPSP